MNLTHGPLRLPCLECGGRTFVIVPWWCRSHRGYHLRRQRCTACCGRGRVDVEAHPAVEERLAS